MNAKDKETLKADTATTQNVGADYSDDNADPRDRISMESGGVIDMDEPGYVENDDVKDSIAEGYF